MPAVRFKDLCIAARDPESVGRFWASALGLQARPHHRPGVVRLCSGDVPLIWVNSVPEPRNGKNRVHLDLRVPALRRLLELGATRLAEHAGWTVLADPEATDDL